MFGEDFLIKLGFDVDTTKLDKVRKELASIQNKASKLVKKKPTSSSKTESNKVKNNLKAENALLRKQQQLLNKINQAKALGVANVSRRFSPSLRGKNFDKMDNRLLMLSKEVEEAKLKKSLQPRGKADNTAANNARLAAQQAKASERKLASEIRNSKEAEHQSISARNQIGYERQKLIMRKVLNKESKKLLKLMERTSRTFNGLNTREVNRDLRHLNNMLHLANLRAMRLKKVFYGMSHGLASVIPALMAAVGAFEAIKAGHTIVVGIEQSMTQLEITFGEGAQKIADTFVEEVRGMNIGVGKVASLQAASQVLPALKDKLGIEGASDAAKNLLWISKFTGQLQEMPAIARNFAQVATSLEQEDINQFADRFTALNPMILKQLEASGKIDTKGGKINQKSALIKAKMAGTIDSSDWMAAFNQVMTNVAKDPALRAKLAAKYTVAHGVMLADIQEALGKFMGEAGLDSTGKQLQPDSLSTALRNAYLEFSEFLKRSGALFRNIGEVFADVVDGLVTVFLKVEEYYLRFALMIKKIFGLTDDESEQAILWGALAVVLAPLVILFGVLGNKLLKMFSLIGTAIGSGGVFPALSALGGTIWRLVKFFGIVPSLIFGLIESFTKNDGGKSMADSIFKLFGQEGAPSSMDWMFRGIGEDNEFDKAEEARKQALIESTYSKIPYMQQRAAKSNQVVPQANNLSDNRNVVNNYTINEAGSPTNTVRAITNLQKGTNPPSYVDMLAMNGG